MPLSSFWLFHPGLLAGLSLFLGFFSALNPSLPAYLPVVVFLVILLLSRCFKGALLLLVVMGATFATVQLYYLHPELPPDGVRGSALFRIDAIVSKSDFGGGQSLYYRGVCLAFKDEEGLLIGKQMPCLVAVQTAEPLSASSLYRFSGKLGQSSPRFYKLKPDKKKEWIPSGWTLSLANLRYQAKKSLNRTLFAAMGNNSTSNFLSGLATGEFSDKLLAMEFSRFGVQHLMAISGFHFAIVVACLQLLLKPFFPFKRGAFLVVFFITFYYLFLGSSPSIQRAWVGTLLFMSAALFERINRPLNTLGIALCLVLFYDPLQSLSMGFQLSFLITAAILVLVKPTEEFFKIFLPQRRLRLALLMNNLDKHLYLFLQFFRKSWSLNFAVHLVALPLTLAFFHKFPFMSLIYNLFFPFLTGFSLSLLLFGIVATPLYPLSLWIHKLNLAYTSFLLDTIYDAPVSLDYCLRARTISPWFLSIYITALFAVALIAQSRRQKV